MIITVSVSNSKYHEIWQRDLKYQNIENDRIRSLLENLIKWLRIKLSDQVTDQSTDYSTERSKFSVRSGRPCSALFLVDNLRGRKVRWYKTETSLWF